MAIFSLFFPQKRPDKASTKEGQKRTEKASTKPPLPKYSASSMRKCVYQATLDLVQSLCDTSSGLVDCFPMEDRMHALREVCVLHEFRSCDGFHFPSLNRVLKNPT
jgi:hypothetical protein